MLQLQPIATPQDTPEAAPEFHGCGWFDSSWDLRQGLLVTEHTCADTAAHALGLDGWLLLHGLVANPKRSCAMIAG